MSMIKDFFDPQQLYYNVDNDFVYVLKMILNTMHQIIIRILLQYSTSMNLDI